MPLYEYHCDTCGHDFEHLARTMNAKAPACPECGGAVSRKLSVFGVAASQPAPAAPASCPGCASAGSCPMAQR